MRSDCCGKLDIVLISFLILRSVKTLLPESFQVFPTKYWIPFMSNHQEQI